MQVFILLPPFEPKCYESKDHILLAYYSILRPSAKKGVESLNNLLNE